MVKSAILQEISDAKIAHRRWVKRAEHLVSGLPVDKEFIPLEADSCKFGKTFLYGEVGRELRIFEVFKYDLEQVEYLHTSLHDLYAKIYEIFFVIPEKRSFLYKLTHFDSNNPNKQEKEEAEKYLLSLKETSSELIKMLDKVEAKVREANLVDLSRQLMS